MMDKWSNMYPEPDGPPDLPTPNQYGFSINRTFGQVPSFGQASFPKYGPSDSFSFTSPNASFRGPISPYEAGQNWPGFTSYTQKPFQHEMRRENLFMGNKFYDPPTRFEQQMSQNERLFLNPNSLNTRGGFDSEKFKQPSFLNYRSLQDNPFNLKSFRPDSIKTPFAPFQRKNYCNGNVFTAKPRNFSRQDLKDFNFAKQIQSKNLGNQASNLDLRKHPFGNSSSERKICDCMSKSQEDLSRFNAEAKNYRIQKETDNSCKLFARSKSVENLNAATQTMIEKNPFTSKIQLTASTSFEDLVKATQGPKKQVIECSSNDKDVAKDKTNSDAVVAKGNDLPETDLRHVLMARRRSFAGKSEEAPTDVKRIRTSYPAERKSESPKKKVTFDLGVEEYSLAGDEPDCDDIQPDKTETTENAVMETDESSEACYIVVDTEVLLSEYPLVEKFVQSDTSYSLLVPQVVKAEVEALSVGLCNGRQQVVQARQILRKLAEPPEYLIVEPVDTEGTNDYAELTDDPILICCLQVFYEGYSAVLVTNSEELQNKALSLEIYCYTTENIKEFLTDLQPEVSFDLKKIDNNNTVTNNNFNSENVTDIPVNCTRRQLFGGTSGNENNEKVFRENDIIKSEINRKIENLKLDETDSSNNQTKIDFNNRLKELAGKQTKNTFTFKNDPNLNFKITAGSSIFKTNNEDLQNGGEGSSSKFKCSGDSSTFLERGCQVMEVTSTANKKKNKNINTYNLNEHLKRFEVRNGFVEERIVTRLDEWLCSFSQIMEVTLLDVLKSLSVPHTVLEVAQLALSSLVECIGECVQDRTVQALVTLLTAEIATWYATDQCSGSHNFIRPSMKPSDFMKMLGCGTLLIKCLRGIYPENTELEEGESLLKQLLHNIEDMNTDIEPGTPVCKTVNTTEHTNIRTENFVKKPTEVLEYLKKHFPNWKSCDNSNNDSNTLQTTSRGKIVRTCGKKIGQLKINTDKTIILTDDKINETKKQEKGKKTDQNVKENLTGAKLMKKLVTESKNLTPKMKEIDIERREAVNKEMLDMIGNILDSGKQMGNILSNVKENNNAFNTPIATKFTRTFDKTDIICEKITKDTKPDNEMEKGPLDLDALDYSDFDNSDTLVNTIGSNEPINIDKSLTNDSSKTDDGHKTNDISQANDNNPIFDESSNTFDSGFHEGTVYTFIKHFLAKLVHTFKDIHNYMDGTVKKIQQEKNSDLKEVAQFGTDILKDYIETVIDQLKLIKERDSGTPSSASLASACDAVANELQVQTYRQIIKNMLTQARVLRDSLILLNQIILKEFAD